MTFWIPLPFDSLLMLELMKNSLLMGKFMVIFLLCHLSLINLASKGYLSRAIAPTFFFFFIYWADCSIQDTVFPSFQLLFYLIIFLSIYSIIPFAT